MHVVFNGDQYFVSGNHFIILGRQKVTLKSIVLGVLKGQVKKNNPALLALRIQNITIYDARNTIVCLVLSLRMMKLFRAGERAVQSHIVSHVSEKLSMEEHEKVERNDSNETGKNRDLQKQEDPGLPLSPYMK